MEDFLVEILGFILEFSLEVLLQFLFEEGIAAASRLHRRFRFIPLLRITLSRANPPLTVLKFTLLGVALGFLSVFCFRIPSYIHPGCTESVC